MLGAALALLALIAHRVLGWEWPDAVASLIIGGLLAFVAWRMASRNRALLSNQAVAPALEPVRSAITDDTPFVRRLYLTPVRNLRGEPL